MLRTLILSALAGALALAASAHAQTEDVRSVANTQLRTVCTGLLGAEAGTGDTSPQCRCFAEVMLEGWAEREVTLFARVFAHYPDRDAARVELEGMMANEGYTMADYQAVGQRLSRSAEIVGGRCDGATQ